MRGWALVVIALGACGDGLALPDAGVRPDSDRGLVTVQFLSDQSLPGGHTVYFQNVDSSLVLSTRTDDDGRANAFMGPGGFVTLVADRGGSQILYTHVDVAPGEPLVIDERFGGGRQGQTVFTLRIPADPGATFYQLNTSCGSQDVRGAELGPLQVVLDDCDGLTDLLVMAFGERVRYLYAEDVDVSLTSVVLAGPYRDTVVSTISAFTLPAAVTQMSATQSLIHRRRALYTQSATSDVVDGASAATVEMFVPPEGTLMTRLDPFSSGVAVSVPHVIDWRPATEMMTFDFAGLSLRAYTARPRFEPQSNAVRWTEDPSGAVADAVLAGLAWSDPVGRSRNWNVLAPRTEDPVLRLPVLPRADLVPAADTFVFDLTSLGIEGGYERVRSHLLGAWHPTNGLPWPADGDAGHIVFRALNPNEL